MIGALSIDGGYLRFFCTIMCCFSDDLFKEKEKSKEITDDLDSTFAELTGY